MSFLEQSLSPSIFWSAISAIGTLLAILVALLFPIYSQFKKNNHIELVLLAEVKENYKQVKKISLESMPGPSKNQKIPAFQRNDAVIIYIKLNLWSQLKYELATNRPKSFKKFNDINNIIERLHYSKSQPENFRAILQSSAAEDFTSKYKELFSK